MNAIYIVGAQCVGKTTLTEALILRMKETSPELHLTAINEMARSVLEKHKFTRDDVRYDSCRCIQLQTLILWAQHQKEMELSPDIVLVSDRSGIDPLVYASIFAKDQSQSLEELRTGTHWTELTERMRQAVVVVCEPVEQWLFDDGVRLMPTSIDEWMALHDGFCNLLRSNKIPYTVLPSTLQSLPARVDFVLSLWNTARGGSAGKKGYNESRTGTTVEESSTNRIKD